MAQQWRVECDECGKEQADYFRMHSQLTGNDHREAVDQNGEFDDDDTLIECNVCGNIQVAPE
mgnify:CR=1 FL=1